MNGMPLDSVHSDTSPIKSAHDTTAAPVAEGEDDVLSRFAEIGLTPRTGWYASIALYAVGAVPAIALSLIDPDAFPRVFLWLGLVSLSVAVLSVIGLKHFPNSVRATHMRLTIGLLILTTGAFVVGDARQAFVMLPLTTVLPPAIYFGVREAAAYAFIAGIVVATCLALLNEPWAYAMALCSTTAVVTVAISMMIAQAKTRRVAREFRQLAYSDPLTGLANARSLHENLADALADAVVTGERVALYAIDLDNFKRVNDELGYAVGDELLAAVGEALTHAVDQQDLAVRRGGDEFSVLVRAPGTRDLRRLGVKIEQAIGCARERVCPEITPSASVAFVRSRPADDVATILQRADDALHETKSAFHADDVVGNVPRIATLDVRSESERADGEKRPAASRLTRRQDHERKHVGLARLLRGSKRIDRPDWFYAATMQLVIALALVAVVVLDSAGGFSGRDGLVFGGSMLALAACSVMAAKAPLARNLIHVAFAASIVVLALAVNAAGSSGAALLDLFVIFALFGFHFFNAKAAAAYLIAALALYGYLAVAGSFPFAEARVAVVAIATLSGATLVAKVRSVTSRFIVQNWELSQRDALTGAANVRALRARLDSLTKRANSGKIEVAMIALDLDEFKQVNDRFSHSTGDETLVAVTRAIENNTRFEDLVARRGGDEFVVLIEGADSEEVERLADRIRASIAHTRGRICANLVPDASVVCVFHERGDDSDMFLGKADAALHERKLESRRERIDEVA